MKLHAIASCYMRSSFLEMLRLSQETFGLYHNSLTYIEGGLGSQILGLISFYESQEEYGRDTARVNLSYYDHTNKPTLRPWELDKFRVYIEDLRPYEVRKRRDLLRAKTDFLTDSRIRRRYWSRCRAKYLERFWFDQTKVEGFLGRVTGSHKTDSYGVVHIRRGDYLQVASRHIGFSEYSNLLKTMEKLIPETLFVVSDSKLEDSEIEELKNLFGSDHRVVPLDGAHHDSFAIHCLMRSSDFLVTSNSTFSFSAGLLGKDDQVVFSPVEFHSGKQSEKYNKSFRSITRFGAWDLSSSGIRI